MNYTILALIASCVVFIPAAHAQDLPPVEATEKESRKMDHTLAALYDSAVAGNAQTPPSPALSRSSGGQTVQVVLEMTGTDAPIPENLGIQVQTSHGNLVQATVPVRNLAAISSNENVLTVTAPSRPHSLHHVTSEGAAVIGSSIVNTSGYAGEGIKIAVIDVGFDVNNSEIAANIAGYDSFHSDGTGIDAGGDTAHGTGVAEIIVDVAPDAELYLYNFGTPVEFLNMVDHIIARGDIRVASMSLGYTPVGPADGSSIISQKVNEARESGILWVNAAGNEAGSHWQGQFSDPDGDNWHDFSGADETIDVDVHPEYPIEVSLSWESPSQDYDLCLYDDALDKITCSKNSQPGFPPFEYVYYEPTAVQTVHISIYKFDSDRNVNFQLFSHPYALGEYAVASSSLLIPADAAGSFSVAASHWRNDVLEPYSSQGPTLDGRIKPDIAAPTRVSTTAYGPESFGGTSAAAPHVAGAAALVMEKYPAATADQVQKLLESTVDSRHAKSNRDGTGRLDVSMFADADIIALDNSNSSCGSMCFFPATLTVPLNTEVTWVNADTEPISIHAGTEFAGPLLLRGGSYSNTFDAAGTYAYTDSLHPWAAGTVTVGSDPPPSDLDALISEVSALREMIERLNAMMADLTARVAALEDGAGTPPPPDPTGLTGKVYFDTNGDGVLDAGEPGVPGMTVLAYGYETMQTTQTTTDANGGYAMPLPGGGYLIQVEGTAAFAYITMPDDGALTQNFGI